MKTCKFLYAILILLVGMPTLTGCNDDDEFICGDPAFVKDSEGRWKFGPVASVGCRHFLDYAANHEWEQVSITTLNAKGEEVAVSDPAAYGDPLHIMITPNSIIDLGSDTSDGATYQYDLLKQPIPEGVLVSQWDPLNDFVGIIGGRWHPGLLYLTKIDGEPVPTEMSLIDYYPKVCIRKMKPIL